MKITHSSTNRRSHLRAFAYDVLCLRDGLSGWKHHRDLFHASSRLDAAAVRDVSVRKLVRLLNHAFATSPYYRQHWSDVGFRTADRFDEAALADLPFLTKDIIRSDKATLVSTQFKEADLELSYTGGTTGSQTAFYLDRACKLTRVGRQWGMFEQCGYHPGMRRAMIWGVHTDLPPAGVPANLKARFRRFATSDETLCCTVMDADEMVAFHRRVEALGATVLHGYPSALVEFARFIDERKLRPIQFPRILTTAEVLTPSTRDRLSAAFGGEVFNLYCTREYGSIAFECSKHRGLHIDSESLWVEIIKDGRAVPPGESGEIVITDLNNYGMPFVRSRTGDMGSLSATACDCGLPWPLLQGLDGRDSDVVFRPDGRVVPALMLSDLLMDFPGVRAQQFVQSDPERIDVFLVVTGDFPIHGVSEVEKEVRSLMGDTIEVGVQKVERIDRNPVSGKIREVICNVPAARRDSLKVASLR